MGSYSLEVDQLEIIKNETKPNSNPIIYKGSGKDETVRDFVSIHYLSAGQEIGLQSFCNELIGYQLFDLTGRKWKSGQFNYKTSINAGDIPKGIYLIYLETNKLGSMSRKIQVD